MKNEAQWGEGGAAPVPDLAQVEAWLDAGEALRLQPWLDQLLEAPDLDLRLQALRALSHLGAERASDAAVLRLARAHPTHVGLQIGLLRCVLGNRGAFAYWEAAQRRPLPEEPAQRAERLSLDALWLASLRDAGRALAASDEALRLASSDPWICVERSYVLARLDRPEPAREAVLQALALRPAYRTALLQLARLELQREQPEQTRLLLEPLLAATGNAHAAWQLALLAADEERHADALNLLDAAERGWPRADPRWADSFAARRADALLHLGQREPAREQALKLPKQRFYSALAERLAGEEPARRRLLPLARITQHWMTCAPATLAALARFWGREAQHLEVAQAICYDGTPYASQRRWAREQGFEVREFKLDWPTSLALIDAGIPFALGTQHVGGGHLQAVVGYDALRGSLLIRDPGQALHAEYEAATLFDSQQSGGPRALLLLPPEELRRLQGITLPELAAWDESHALQAALHSHDRPAALAALQALERIEPEGDSLLRARRSLAIYDGDEPRILAATEALLLRYPQDGDLHLSRIASLYEVQGQGAGDAALAARAAEPWPDPLLLARWSGRMAADGRRQAEALAVARRALRRDGSCGRAWSELSDRLWSLRGVAQALAPARWASTLMPTEEWAASAYARACRVAGRADEGLGWLREREQVWGDRSAQPALTLADELDNQQRDPEADRLLDAALQRRPQDAALRIALAERRLRQQRLDEAEALLDGCSEAHAPGLLRQRALLLESRGQLEPALAAAREAVALEPLQLPHHRLLLRLLRRQLGNAEALLAWRPLADAHPAHLGLQRLLYEALPDQAEAINEQLERLQQRHPLNAWLQRERAVQASRQGRDEDALALATAACALAPDVASGHDVLAYCQLRARGYAAALPHLHEALRRDAEYEGALRRLLNSAPDLDAQRAGCDFVAAEMRRQPLLGDGLLSFQVEAKAWLPEQLLALLQELAAFWPLLWQGPIAVARQLLEMQRSPEALQVLREAAERFPALPRVHLELAEALRQAGDAQAAIAANARTLALAPAWNRALRLQVDLLGDYGRQWVLAAQLLEHALAQREGFDDADLIGLLGWVLEQQQRDAEALQQIRRSLYLDPRAGWVWRTAWRICERAERLSDFDVLIDEVQASRPGDSQAWLVRAEQGRDDAQALAAAEQAIALEPRLEAAWIARFERLQRLGRGAEIEALLRDLPWPDTPPLALREWGPRQQWVAGQRPQAVAALQALRSEAPLDEALCVRHADWVDELDDQEAYVRVARELLAIAPLAARSHGYLGHALLKAGRAAEALPPLQQALALSPGYAFAAAQLAEAARRAGQPDLAEPALQALWPHRETVHTACLGVEMAVAAGQAERAEAWLQRLFALDEYEIPRCREVLTAWRAVGPSWAARLQLLQCEQVRRGGGPVGVVMDWLAQRERRSFWWALVEAWRWQGQTTAVEPHLLRGLLRWLSDNDAGFSLKRLIRRFEPQLRADLTGWGEVSYALHSMDEYQALWRWMHDWREQPRAPAYALANLAGALAVLGRWTELRELLAHALPRFPYQENLRLWQLLLQARDRDAEALRDGLAHVQEWTPDSWMLPLLDALRAGLPLLQGERLSPEQRAKLRMPRQGLPVVGKVLMRELRRTLLMPAWLRRWTGY